MKIKTIITVLVLFLTLLSFGQIRKYDIIKKDVVYYEFNGNRDKILLKTKDRKLFIYDISKDSIYAILTDQLIYTTSGGPKEFFCVKDDLFYSVTSSKIYVINNEQLEIIPFVATRDRTYNDWVSDEYRFETYDELNKYLEDLNAVNVYTLPDEVYLLLDTESDGLIGVRVDNLDEEAAISKKLLESAVPFPHIQNKSFEIKNMGLNSTSLNFGNISIKETAYQKSIINIMSSSPRWKYKIKIITKNENIKLRDSQKRGRVAYYNDKKYNCNMAKEFVTHSKYISDKNGDIYMLFHFNRDYQRDLIKISLD